MSQSKAGEEKTGELRIGGGEKGGEAMPLWARGGGAGGRCEDLSIVSNTHHFFSANAE